MVAGKMKVAMGLQKPSSPSPPADQSFKFYPSPSPSSTTTTSKSSSAQKSTVFSRSFGVYFPRSSAQVQPRPPDVSQLIRLVEELRDKESHLKTELLELKLLKESAAIVPFLEGEISDKEMEIGCLVKRIESLEAENEGLRSEAESLRGKMEEERLESERKVKELVMEMAAMKRSLMVSVSERGFTSRSSVMEIDNECSGSSSQRFQGLIDVAARSKLLMNLRKPVVKSNVVQNNHKVVGVDFVVGGEADLKINIAEERDIEDNNAIVTDKCRLPRVPKPPPKPLSLKTTTTATTPLSSPTTSTSSPCSSSTESGEDSSSEKANTANAAPSAPPPPPPPLKAPATKALPPPPPPPPPVRAMGGRVAAAKVKRVPEVAEFYHSLMRRDSSRRDSGVGAGAGAAEAPAAANAANARDMIGEIENRSAHLIAIKSDVETQGDFIKFLIKEVETAAFTDIEDVVAFVKWLDDELSYLVDERAVLKHFEWPEQKADALREAAFGYCDLKKLESEASSFGDDSRQPCSPAPALKKMQSLLEKLEHGAYNLSRMKESATKKYKGFHIPTEWLLETGLVSQIKLASVKLAMKYMRRVSAELEAVGHGPEEEELMLQGVRFAFRVHQFAGGFDIETMRAFQELRDKARSCRIQCQNQQQQQQQQQQKLFCRSTSC
ncbi:hypothetical protein Sjap_025912 [Stephania japonica]|uniref:Protein CHUP1, chloroplastic n=1 Tax=Stephania japonica TaxID=461633 RepID=A0AAP0HIE3_9MAGN